MAVRNIALSSSVDDTFFLNLGGPGVEATLESQSPNTPNSGIVGVIEHELTENVMGRIGVLDIDKQNLPTVQPAGVGTGGFLPRQQRRAILFDA